jgi:transcriptional regulator with XRE-family HTH domain
MKSNSSHHGFVDEVALQVKRHRQAARLSRRELAELAGVGTNVLYQIETGHPNVKLGTLLVVLTALNMTLRLESPLMSGSRA